MRIRLLALQVKRSCQASHKGSVLAKEGRFQAQNLPESQTLIVMSHEPETIFDPSGEKSTEVIQLLWALSSLDLSSRVPEDGGSRRVSSEESLHAKSETAHLHPTL